MFENQTKPQQVNRYRLSTLRRRCARMLHCVRVHGEPMHSCIGGIGILACQHISVDCPATGGRLYISMHRTAGVRHQRATTYAMDRTHDRGLNNRALMLALSNWCWELTVQTTKSTPGKNKVPDTNDECCSQSEQLPQPLGLRAAHRDFGLLPIVHSDLVGALEPRDDFLDAVDVHQV